MKYLRTLTQFIFILAISSFSLIHARPIGDPPTTEPQKVDQFESVGSCDHSARLDNFAIHLANDPNLVGYVIAYGPEGDSSGSGNFRLLVTKDYLVNSRGISEDRLVTIYGGPYKDLRESATELWVSPRGAAAPKPTHYENEAARFTGKFAEISASDGLTLLAADDEVGGPPVGDATFAGFADILRLQPKSRGYLVVFDGHLSLPGASDRVGKRHTRALRENYGVNADRLRVIFGGYEEEAKVDLWVLPADAPPPVEAKREQREVSDVVQRGAFTQVELKTEDGAKRIINDLAEILSSDKKLTAVVVVRLKVESPDDVQSEEALENSDVSKSETTEVNKTEPEEVPDLNLTDLVESWKQELAENHKISAERLVVIVAPSQAAAPGGELETWILPPGAPMPNPYSMEVPIEEDSPVENPQP